MNLFNKSANSVKNITSPQIILCILLILYLISGINTPYSMTPYVNNIFMYVSLLLITYLLYKNSCILLVILFAISALVFIMRSRSMNPVIMQPSQANKDQYMKTLNTENKKTTLEEEVVGQIQKNNDNLPSIDSYHPVLCNSHNATKL